MANGHPGWGTDTTRSDPSLSSLQGTGYLDDHFGPTVQFDAPAWLGEYETYGTQSDWLTGEGLTTAWGNDPKDRIRSTYPHPAMEYIAENPLPRVAGIDARGMLQRGGKPGPWDYAALGLSMIPVAGPAAVKMATPFVKNTLAPALKNVFKKPYQSVIDQTPHLSSVKPGATEALTIPAKPGMTLRGTKYDDPYMYMAFPETAPTIYRGTALGNEALRLNANALLKDLPSAKDVMRMPADEFYAMDTKIQDRLLKNADLTRKDIETIHWVNEGKEVHVAMASLADELGNSALAAEINAAIKARDKLISNLSNPERQRLGLGSTAISDALMEAFEQQAILQLKPGHLNMSDEIWTGLVKGKTLSEAKDIARKLTLRIVE